MTRTILTLCITAVMALPVFGAEKTATPMTLETFVAEAIRKDTEFESILLDELRLKYQKDLRLPARDLVVSARQDFNVFVDGTNDWSTTIGLDKLFPMTGTEVSGEYSVTPRHSGDTSGSVGLMLSQSIARNAFGRSTRLLDQVVGIETNIAQHQVIEAYEDYLASVITAYHEWSGAYERLQVGQSSYDANVKLLDNIRDRQTKQIAKKVDVNKITLQVAGRKESLISLEESYKQQTGVISRMLRRDNLEGIVPSPAMPTILKHQDFEKRFTEFRTQSRTFRVLDLLTKKSDLDVERQADDLLPSLDLLVGMEMEGEGGELSGREETIFAGLKLEWPFPNQKDKAELETARLDLRSAELRKTNVRYRLFSDLLTLHHELRKEQRLIDVARQKIKLAEEVVTAESENYSFGRITLNDYIQAVNALDSARLNNITRSTRYKLLLTEWRRLTDTLVSPSSVRR